MIDAAAQPPTPPGVPRAAPLRVALGHDWLVALRGGELVLDAIARLLRNDGHAVTRLYTMFDAGEPLTPALAAIARTASSINRMPPALRRWLLMRYPAAVRQLSSRLGDDHLREPIDLLLTTHSAAIKAIAPPPAVPHLCYCHSPARYLWSQADAYAAPGLKGRLRATGLRTFASSLIDWDRRSAGGVTRFLANSSHTAAEIKRCYHRDAPVVHPPVRTEFFTPANTPRTDRLLLVSALEPYKRVELAIDAACIARRRLTVVGSGSDGSRLRDHARRAQRRHGLCDHIEFTGRIDDEALLTRYRTAGVFLFPQIEDFGITAVEAQAAGCPVVARRAGGALDTVIESETGAFFDEPTAEALADAIARAPVSSDTARRCRQNAVRFTEEAFFARMREQIAAVTARG